MIQTDLQELYQRTLESKHCHPSEGELDSWRNVLGQFSRADLDAALRRWDSDTTVEEYTQRPKGARMPTPAELRLSIQKFNRAATSAKSGHFQACREKGCSDGWITISKKSESGKESKAVVRCQCWVDYVKRVKAGA